MSAPKREEQTQARELRRQGLSVNEIASKLSVSKSSVSLWVRDISLTEEQHRALKERSWSGQIAGREKARLVNEQRFAERMAALKRRAHEMVEAHGDEPLFVAGVMLYQAEGSRSHRCAEICSSDPRFLALFKRWVDTYAPGHKFTLKIRLFYDNDEQESIKYWTSQVSVERVKILWREGGKRGKGKLPYGVAGLYVHASTDLTCILGHIFTALAERLS